MGRFKPLKRENTQLKPAKKRERIAMAVTAIWILLLLVCIIIGGIHQHDQGVVGWMLVTVGIVSLPAAVFYVYIFIKGWKFPSTWDKAEVTQYMTKEIREKLETEDRLFSVLTIFFSLLMTFIPPLAGVWRLLGYL